jgi:hypothetical protein
VGVAMPANILVTVLLTEISTFQKEKRKKLDFPRPVAIVFRMNALY